MQYTNPPEIEVTITSVADSMKFNVSYVTAIEMLHIFGMEKWEATAPPPGKYGYRDDQELQNSQQARLQYLLEGVGFQNPDETYSTLAVKNRNERGSGPKVTRTRPIQGLQLPGGWYLDCCLNLNQKLYIVETLSHLGYSRDFINTAQQFVMGGMVGKSNKSTVSPESITGS